MTSAKAWGIDARLLTPAEIKELVPFINEEILLGGFYTPSVSCVDSLETGTQMRNEAVGKGALQVVRQHRGARHRDRGRPRRTAVTAVVTNQGRIECEYVAIACGVWSPRIAKMAGANIPLTPAVHQMTDVGPIDILAAERQGGRLPDRPRHGHVLLRAPDRRLDGGRLATPTARSSCTPTTSRRTTNRRCRRPSCRSRPTTSTSSSKRRSS